MRLEEELNLTEKEITVLQDFPRARWRESIASIRNIVDYAERNADTPEGQVALIENLRDQLECDSLNAGYYSELRAQKARRYIKVL